MAIAIDKWLPQTEQEVMMNHPGATDLMLWHNELIIGYRLNGVMMIAEDLHNKLKERARRH